VCVCVCVLCVEKRMGKNNEGEMTKYTSMSI
jgi:hypothetical protein